MGLLNTMKDWHLLKDCHEKPFYSLPSIKRLYCHLVCTGNSQVSLSAVCTGLVISNGSFLPPRQPLNLQLENFAVQTRGNKCIISYVRTHVCVYFSPLDTLICSSVSHALKPIRSSDIKPLPVNQHDTSASLISRPWESSYWFSVCASEKRPFVFTAVRR